MRYNSYNNDLKVIMLVKPINSRFKTPVEDLDCWDELTENRYAASTVLSLRKDWHHFLEHCQINQVCPLPATVATILRYLDGMSRERKYATIRRYLISINTMHKLHHLPEPSRFKEVQSLMSQYRINKKNDQIQADAFRHEHLNALFSLLSKSQSLKDFRDLAIWSVMFETLVKRSELITMTTENYNEKECCLTIDDQPYWLSNETAQALRLWLHHAQIEEGYLFRSLDRHENISETPMDPSAVYRVFRRASTLLELPKHVTFSGQSPRVGASKDLAANGASLTEVQSAGRWKSPAMPAQYLDDKEKSEREKERYKKKKQWL